MVMYCVCWKLFVCIGLIMCEFVDWFVVELVELFDVVVMLFGVNDVMGGVLFVCWFV